VSILEIQSEFTNTAAVGRYEVINRSARPSPQHTVNLTLI
jgi:hypothetical protein